MKVAIEHALPHRLDYAQLYLEVGGLSFFFKVDGRTLVFTSRIGGKAPMRPGAPALSDPAYSRYRVRRPVKDILDYDEDRVVVKTYEGFEEEWVRPRWILKRVKLGRDGRRRP